MSRKYLVVLVIIFASVYGGMRYWMQANEPLKPRDIGVSVKKNLATDQYSVVDLLDNVDMAMPVDVATDSMNNVYVTSCSSHDIYVFDDQGNYVRTIGELGQGQGQFYYPRAIYIYNDLVYVGDSGNKRIQILSTNGEFLEEIVLPTKPRITIKDLVVVDNKIYITSDTLSRSDKIYVFDEARTLHSLGGFFDRFNGFLAVEGNGQVVFFDANNVYETVYFVGDHRLVKGFKRPTGLYQTRGVVFCKKANVFYINHFNKQQVDMLSAEGDYLETIYAADMSNPGFSLDTFFGITVDNCGVIYTVGRNRVIKITLKTGGVL